MSANPKRLGQYVLARRTELGLSQSEVADAGGPSDTTLSKLENEGVDVVSNQTLKKLDAPLRWRAGSARAVLYGAEPAEIVDATVEAPAASVGGSTQTEPLNTRKPEWMSDEQWRSILRENADHFQFLLDKAARER